MRRFFYFNILVARYAFGLVGCATAPKAPTAFPPSYPVIHAAATHTVVRGETLYRIAKMYHVEVNELMRVNHISNPSQLSTGMTLTIPGGAPLMPPVTMMGSQPYSIEEVRTIVGSKKFKYPWKTITVHHSGTLKGSGQLFDRDHRRRHMGGLFYHFVIGNGTNTRMGYIETGWRWKSQVKANRPYDIQICLVGNFDRQQISDAQFNTLVNLIQVLREQYGIPKSSVRQHRDIPGKHTDCPGRNFPFRRLISTLT